MFGCTDFFHQIKYDFYSGIVAEICVASDNDPAKVWILNEGSSYIRDVEQIDPVIAAWDLGLGESHVLT
ncbi:MAG: hypothetical protein RMX96_29015 [Nostoc sp. ChiSLP02]|nr:hypothetical protein [Nostoc sp. DedSLP05]MDZ8100677.1 hypothetical protein [Nostoc sp. DedSLP01]MDZ8188882.1 hypothetical protein [Nostoc sp. ChiSLP02]